MTISNTSTCVHCGGELKHYDTVKRVVRTGGGDKYWIKIKRVRCVTCRVIRRQLPDSMLPFKQYDGEIIKGVLEGYITPETLGFEDYPSEITMKRWREIYIALYEEINT